MVQKILRTMQDDLREAKAVRGAKPETDKQPAATKPAAPVQVPPQASPAQTVTEIARPAAPAQTVTEIAKPAPQRPAVPARPAPQSPRPGAEEVRRELEEMPALSSQARTAAAPVAPRSRGADNKTKDEEFSNLIKRVSASMAGNSRPAQLRPAEPTKPDKDRELKELIERMSHSMEEEKEMLRQEKPASAPAPARETAESSASSLIKSVIHKIEDGIENKGQEAAASAAPQDTYWEKMHDTLKSEEEGPGQEMIAEIKKEILLDPNPAQPAVPKPKAANISQKIPKETGQAVPEKARQPASTPEEQGAGLITPVSSKPATSKVWPKPKEESVVFDYMTPENRLIFGKQEYYSSLRKRVRIKTSEKSLEGLDETLKRDEVKLSDAEEKKMLRHQIIKKYKINLFTLPWAKIIIFTILFLSTIGAGLYLILPKVKPETTAPIELVTGENIASVDAKVTQEVSVKEKTVTAINYFDGSLAPWQSFNSGDVIEVKIKYDDHDILLPRDEALRAVLGKEQFNSIPKEVMNFFDQKYDILAYKNGDMLRLGIVLEFDQSRKDEFRAAMLNWEATDVQNQKMYSVMKALFTSSKLTETEVTTFQPATYNDTELKYVNLPDTDTSMDYVIYDNLIFFTTSKDTTFEAIDLAKKQMP